MQSLMLILRCYLTTFKHATKYCQMGNLLSGETAHVKGHADIACFDPYSSSMLYSMAPPRRCPAAAPPLPRRCPATPSHRPFTRKIRNYRRHPHRKATRFPSFALPFFHSGSLVPLFSFLNCEKSSNRGGPIPILGTKIFDLSANGIF